MIHFFSKICVKQKKKKKIDVGNKDIIISKPKKRTTTDVIKIFDQKQKKVCSYSNCFFLKI